MNLKSTTQTLLLAAALAAATTTARAESSNSVTFEGWANDTAVQYNGRIPRDVYLDEMGRRWDADSVHRVPRDIYLRDLRSRWETVDRDNRGLTPADVSRMTGNVDSTGAGMPRSGSGAQPGNMGPSNSKGQ
jgi:hypothetical protein